MKIDDRIKVIKGDITQITVEAIVNAANKSLLSGGGVDGAIHSAGGNEIQQECIQIRNKQGGCKPGDAVITTAGRLSAKYVIHAVGPVWVGGSKNEELILKNCYKNSLMLAVNANIKTIAFPNISTGIYKYPKEQAAKVAITTVNDFLENNEEILEVKFVCFDSENFELYNAIIQERN